MLEKTQPSRRMDQRQALRPLPARRKSCCLSGCLLPLLFLTFLVFGYFFAPLRTNLLLLGTDDSLERGSVGRTDTMILTTIVPLQPYVGMLSIPRDLWVNVPGVGEQRINTAYFFAEANTPGSGGNAALQTVRENFHVNLRYYAVIHMSGLVAVVNALGGVNIQLESPLGGFAAGSHHLTGEQALNFVRERNSSDDFSRMVRAQILLSAISRKAINPSYWHSLPQFIYSLTDVVESNVPMWQWPRLLFALLRGFLSGIDSQTITREMVTPFQTSQGAQVLAPNWQAINPLLSRMFGG